MNPQRVRLLKEGTAGKGPVVYWMSRDQRAADNWALLYAQDLALRRQVPLVVAFCLVPAFLGATQRQYRFMLGGLRQVEVDLAAAGIRFQLLLGAPEEELARLVAALDAGELVVDFDPLRIKRAWRSQVSAQVGIPVYEVDAHNVVPCWVASPKQEYGAYTIRPKIQRLLHEFLEPFPPLDRHPFPAADSGSTNWDAAEATLRVDRSVGEVTWLRPGEAAAREMLQLFLRSKLADYDAHRNDPTYDAQSNLSPYLHFGQVSAQRVALEAQAWPEHEAARGSFLEELIVRRELADNYCLYNAEYDSFAGFPSWAQETLNAHRNDPRPYLYSVEALECGKTHDELWNAAQMEMVRRGKMHGYMRMYWAKKILEWSASPEEAVEFAIYLNDRYELDGRDPNGYTGVAWSIGGVHDRPWAERQICGKIRYMSYNGARRKFDVQAYVQRQLGAGADVN
jgi:deoxyribodipyrimidine photo-lyase